MKNLLSILFGICLVCAISCKNEAKTAEGETEAATEQTAEIKDDKSGPEYTSNYICPMHCPGSGSDTIGVCATCGMDYVVNDKKEGHDHEGHDHDDHEGHEH